jgi:hypothetical protein
MESSNMKDMVIDACKWYVDESSEENVKKRAAEEFSNRYKPLLHFFKETGLVHEDKTEERNWLDFELKMSDFTDEGLELLMLCHDKWLDAISRGSNPGNITLWQRQLIRLREEDPMLLH